MQTLWVCGALRGRVRQGFAPDPAAARRERPSVAQVGRSDSSSVGWDGTPAHEPAGTGWRANRAADYERVPIFSDLWRF